MSLLVKVGADTSDLRDELDKTEGVAHRSSASIVKGLASIGGAVVVGGIAAASAGAIALGGVLVKATQSASEAQDIQSQLAAVIAQTGDATGVTVEQIDAMAKSLSTVTKFDDEVITSAGAVLARFDKIGSDTMPAAMQATLDLAQSLGIDLSSAATMVGKVLQTPGEGMLRLKAAGVALSDEQTKLIQSLFDTGKTAEAQDMILQALSGTMGGAAQAAGTTLSGRMSILKTQFGNIMETVGGSLLPVLTSLANTLSTKLADPAVQAWITGFTQGIAQLAAKVVAYIPVAISWIQKIGAWFIDNKGVIVGILAALGVAVATFVYMVVLPAIGTMIATLAPVILVMALVGAAAYLVYQAWTNNWGGIQDKLKAVWAFLEPIFITIKTWLQENIPIALQTLANFWNTVLLPVIIAVWSWISANLIPLLASIAQFLGVTIVLAITAMVGFWQKVLWPALQEVAEWIDKNLMPIIETLVEWIGERLPGAWANITSAIQTVIGWIETFTAKIGAIKLPDWLTPGSPTPFELGLRGIGGALQDLSSIKLPSLQMELAATGVAGNQAGVTNNFNLNMQTNASSSTLRRDFAMMQTMARV